MKISQTKDWLIKISLGAAFIIAIFVFANQSFLFSKEPFKLSDPGKESPIDYEKYGVFKNIGSKNYSYQIKDLPGLAAAAGQGVYPNTSHLKDTNYQKFWKKNPRLNPWKYNQSASPQEDFYAWLGTPEKKDLSMGVKLYYAAEALRSAGMNEQAIKAYHAILVHFPRTVTWSGDKSYYWYMAPDVIAHIKKLCATYPELGLELKDAFVDIEKHNTNRPQDDLVIVWPGKLIKSQRQKVNRADFKITSERNFGRIRLVKYNDQFWELLVDNKPFFIKGTTYFPTKVGESAHALNIRPWMWVDDNHNGLNDTLFESWIDQNKNNKQDPGELVIGDAALLKDMGVNSIRVYHGIDEWGNYNPKEYNKELLRKLVKEYGIYSILGDFLGSYTIGSGANWNAGTDYTDEEQKKRMTESVRAMVLDHKDEPYVLMWLLGNENQHNFSRTNALENPKAYAQFINEVAQMIHALDPNHPVAICNLNTTGLKELAQYAPNIDIFGANVYAGAYSMGSIWQMVSHYYDRPVMFTEMGCDAYAEGKGLDEEAQANYFKGNWADILLNKAGNLGEGNAIGGLQFEWMDEWWKTSKGDGWGDPNIHNKEADSGFAYPDGFLHEEWLGIFGQGNGSNSPLLREPRKISEAIKKAWTNESE